MFAVVVKAPASLEISSVSKALTSVAGTRLSLETMLNAILTYGFSTEVFLSIPTDKGSDGLEGVISTEATISMLRRAE